MFLYTLLVIAILIGIVAGFIAFAPQFGKPPEGAHLASIKTSSQYDDSKFENDPIAVARVSFSESMKSLWDMLKGSPNRHPNKKLPSQKLSPEHGDNNHLTWFGHSSFFYEVGNQSIFFDPMLGQYASPVPGVFKRYDYDLPSSAEDLPDLDIVIISHDHYDHLDYGTVKALMAKTKHFIMSLGVGSHLQHWGVPPEKIIELDWWDDVVIDGVTITAVPSQHFSGRSINDGQKTLWAAWIIENDNAKVFFGGDSGYFPGFKTIGEKHGPFDLTLLDSGQYDDAWSTVHMTPEQSVLAHQELKGDTFMPIHWSAFSLARHDWYEPVERASIEAKKSDIQMITPMIGERFNVLSEHPTQKWW